MSARTSACGRPRGRHVQVVVNPANASRDGAAITPLDAEGDGYFSGAIPARARGPLRVPAGRRGKAVSRSGVALPARGPHGPSEIVDPPRSGGPIGVARRRASTGRSSTRCTSARSRREGTWARGDARAAASWRDVGITVHRDDAGRRVPGPLRLGLRRRRSVRADAALRRARRLARASSTRAHALGLGVILDVVYNHLGPDGNYLRAVRAGLLHRRATTNEWGEAINFDGADAGAGARVLHRERRLLDRRVSPRRPAPRRDAADLRQLAPSTSSRRSAARAREAARGRGDRRSSPRTSRRTRGWCGRSTQGGYGLDALWNDDFHHSAMVALTGRREAYYTDYRGTPQEFISAREVRLPVPGPVVPLAAEARAARRRCGRRRRRRSSPSCRTTTRWRTRRAGCAAAPARRARRAGAR